MRTAPALFVYVAIAWAAPAVADSLALRPARDLSYTEVAAGLAHEKLSNQPNDWTESQIELLHKFGDRKLLLARFIATERFGLRDTTASLAGYYPLGQRSTVYAEAAVSDTHRVLPRDALHLQLAHAIGGGWAAAGGLKRLRYDRTNVDIADLTLEYYVSSFRIALTALPSRSSTAGSASSYRVQLGHYYGNESSVQFVVASGDEVETPIAAGTILKTQVRSTAVFGRHWFARDWALTYTLGRTRQGISRRDAAGLGLRYRF